MIHSNVIITIIVVLFILITFLFDIKPLSVIVDQLKYQILMYKEELSIRREKKVNIMNNNDLKGVWKETECDFNDRFEAIIDENSITVYRYDKSKAKYKYNNFDNKYVYWIGTFDIDFDINNEHTIVSNNFKQLSDDIKNVTLYSGIEDTISHDIVKEYIYKAGSLVFLSQYNDERRYIKLNRFDTSNRKPMNELNVIKYIGERQVKFNEIDNVKIELDGYVVQLPYYYDTNEEETTDNYAIVNKLPEDFDYVENKSGGQMFEICHIVRSLSSDNHHAEIYIGEFKNANIGDIKEFVLLEDYNDVKKIDRDYFLGLKECNDSVQSDFIKICKKEIQGNAWSIIEKIYVHKYIDNREQPKIVEDGINYDTWLLDTSTNTVFWIGMSYGYNDTSNYDYITDYKNIIHSLKRQ